MQDISTFYPKPEEGGHSPLFDTPACRGLCSRMHFALNHLIDIFCISAGLAYGVSTIGKSSKNSRALFLYRLGSMMLVIGGGLGWLHYFQDIAWVHGHSYAIFYYGWTFKNLAIGMMVALIIPGFHKEFVPHSKESEL